MKSVKEMSLTELGGYICEHLAKQGIDVVLSGGSVVEIYSSGKYVSCDMDFINRYNEQRKKIVRAMALIGFTEERKYFLHPESKYFIEFPPGPVGVGDELVKMISEISTPLGRLKIISPTDSVKDRLAAYYHWNDLQSLEQAVLVAADNSIDLDDIRKWSEKEGMGDKYQNFLARLNAH